MSESWAFHWVGLEEGCNGLMIRVLPPAYRTWSESGDQQQEYIGEPGAVVGVYSVCVCVCCVCCVCEINTIRTCKMFKEKRTCLCKNGSQHSSFGPYLDGSIFTICCETKWSL